MEPKDPLLLPSWEYDEPDASKKLVKLYQARFVHPLQSVDQILEHLQNCFEMVEITDPATDPDWGKTFLPYLEMEPLKWSLLDKAWEQLSAPRYQKWKLPYCRQNALLFNENKQTSVPLYFFYDTQNSHFFDSRGRFQALFQYYRGIRSRSTIQEKEAYAGSIRFLNEEKAIHAWRDTQKRLFNTKYAQLFLPERVKIDIPEELFALFLTFWKARKEVTMIDLKDQPPEEYLLRFYNAETEVFLRGNQKYLYYHDYVRIRLEEFHPEINRLNRELKSLVSP